MELPNLVTVACFPRRNPGSGHGSDRTYVNEPDSYRQLANDGAKATVASSHLPHKSLQGNINGQDYDDEDETRRWEEAGGGEEKPEVRGREQSTRYNPFIPAVESTDYPSSDYPSAGAPDVPRRRATFHSSSNANVGSENDYFDDGRALKGARMAVEPVNGIPKPNSRGDWSRPADSLSILAPQRNEDRRGVPAQSKLVQRVFGGRGGRGRGVGGRTKMNGRGQRGARGPGTTRDGGEQREDRAESWPVQAELEGKLRELEDEVSCSVMSYSEVWCSNRLILMPECQILAFPTVAFVLMERPRGYAMASTLSLSLSLSSSSLSLSLLSDCTLQGRK